MRAAPFLALAALALIVPPSGAAAAPSPATVKVAIANFAFSPAVLKVAPGTTVVWTNRDDDAHSVVADQGAFHSHALDGGEAFSTTFTAAGTFAYHCGLHPHMTGRIVVGR